MTIAGAVLVGGRSERFGRDKALEPMNGRPMAARVLEVLVDAGCSPCLVVGDPERRYPTPGVEFVDDRLPGAGPLNGVLTALGHVEGPVVVAACDLVALSSATVRSLVETAAQVGVDAAVATVDGRHGAVACWNPSALTIIEQAFESGVRSLREVYEMMSVRTVEVPAAELDDIDTEDDLNRYRRSVGC